MKARNLITTAVLSVCICAASAFAEPQKMQPMTTVSSPTQLAQATPSRDMGQAASTNRTDARANLAAGGTAATTSQPANAKGRRTQYLVVQSFAGNVFYAPISTTATNTAAWTPIQVGDRLGSGMAIRTSWNGSVKLVFDPAEPPTVMSLEGGTLYGIEELAIENGVSKSRFALGVGTVKAGVAESGDVKSDMEITTPTGTLSKKGTDIFGVEYQDGRFRMWLTSEGRGLIRAMQYKLGNQGNLIGFRSRLITPGQFVTQEMFKAIDHVKFDREINVNDVYGQTNSEQLTWLNNHGLAFLLPFGGNTVNFFGSPSEQRTDGNTGVMGGVTTTGLNRATPRGEGDFGIGQTVLPFRQISPVNRKIVRTRQTNCRNDAANQCRATKRIMKRRM